MSSDPPRLQSIAVADAPQAWSAAGFAVEGDRCQVGGVAIELRGRAPGPGLLGLGVTGLAAGADLDGLALWPAPPGEPPLAPAHPNSALAVDHVVAFTPDRSRSVERLRAAGLDLRRLREEPTAAGGGPQAFFRLGKVILELVEQPSLPSPVLWGIAFTVASLEAARAHLGDGMAAVRDAVQPGRRIASLRRSAGLAVPVALMSAGG